MGFFGRLLNSWAGIDDTGPSAAVNIPTAADWPTEPTITYGGLDCVGESNYAEAIAAVLGGNRHRAAIAVLVPEPENPHDRTAVCVYIGARRLGYLAREQAAQMHHRIAADMERLGIVAVEALVLAHDSGMSQVLLEPGADSTVKLLTRAGLVAALLAAGFTPRTDEALGFSMRADGARFRVFCSGGGGNDRAEMVPKYAAALREAGYKARISSDDGYEFVSVSGVKP